MRALIDFMAQFSVCFTQGELALLPFRDICDQSLDDLPPAPLDSGQGHFQRYLFALRSETDPFESRAAVGQAFLNIFATQHGGAFSVRLERWGVLARMF